MTLINPTVPLSSVSTMHQAPMPPWRNDEEIEDYIADPRQFLLDRLALLMPLQVFHNFILVATYYLPPYDTLPSGTKFFRTEKSSDEALWQGKIGLVVGKGPMAFLDEGNIKFHGQNVEIGDWVQFDIMDGRAFSLNRIHCRRLRDTQLILKVTDPALVY